MNRPDRDPARWVNLAKEITLRVVDRNLYAVFLFGSRARDLRNNHGDIDIGLLGEAVVPEQLMIELNEAIDRSDCPLQVDFVDFLRTDSKFKQIALKDIVVWNQPSTIKIK